METCGLPIEVKNDIIESYIKRRKDIQLQGMFHLYCKSYDIPEGLLLDLFTIHYCNFAFFEIIISTQKLSEDFLIQIVENMLDFCCDHPDLDHLAPDPDRIELLQMHLNNICRRQTFSENFIKKYKNVIDWQVLCTYHQLSESVLEEHCFKFNEAIWSAISFRQVLSENFIKKYYNYVNWRNICLYQNLSGNFIEDFIIDSLLWRTGTSMNFRLNFWDYISRNDNIVLSDDFILKHKKKFVWEYFWQNKNEDFIKRYIDEIIISNEQYCDIENSDKYSDEICSLLYDRLNSCNNLSKLIRAL